MAKAINNIYTIVNNPYRYSDILVTFYENYEAREKDLLLSYLVIPLIVNEKSRKKIINLRTTSHITALTSEPRYLVGLSKKVSEMKEITNNSIHIAIQRGLINIDNCSIHRTEVINNYIDCNLDYRKASKKLAKILQELDIVTIYRLLGVKSL